MTDTPPAESPATEETPKEIEVEFHKPKPFHNWREFLKEYVIIVLGVATALAAAASGAIHELPPPNTSRINLTSAMPST